MTPLEYAISLKNLPNMSNIITLIEQVKDAPDPDAYLAKFKSYQGGGSGSYQHKYLKYKSKYLALKEGV